MATGEFAAHHKMISRGVMRMQWVFTASGAGFAMNAPDLTDKTVHVVGPTGGTSQVVLEGSNDGSGATAVWETLHDPQGNDLSTVSGLIETILENPQYIRPRAPTVTTGKSIQVTIIARGGK